MQLDIERAFKAPFFTQSEESIHSIYIKAALISVGAFIAIFVVYFIAAILIAALGPVISNSGAEAIMAVLFILLFIVIFIMFFMMLSLPFGYVNETIKKELSGDEFIMPAWTGKYGKFFIQGLKVQVIFIGYSFLIIVIPLFIMGLIVALIMFATQNNSSMDAMGPLLMIPIMLIYLLLILLWAIIVPFGWIRFAETGRLLSAFNIPFIITKIITNFVEFLIAFIIVIAAFFMIYIVSIIFTICTCYVGSLLFPLLYWFLLPIIFLNLFAQVYKQN